MERLSEREKERIRELVAVGSPAWVIHQEISRSRWAIRRYINSLERPPKREPKRSPLRLSLVEREEISRGLAGGESLRAIGRRLGRAPSTISREVRRPRWPSSVSGVSSRPGRASVARVARRWRSSRSAGDSGRWWRPNSSCGGHHNRSRVGSPRPSRTIRRCACRTQRRSAHLGSRQRDGQHADSPSTPVSPSTSATREARGNGAATRTPTVCCGSTSPSAPTSESTPKPTSTRSPTSSTTSTDPRLDVTIPSTRRGVALTTGEQEHCVCSRARRSSKVCPSSPVTCRSPSTGS